MKFLFRILKNAFVRHLAAEGLEVVEKAALETLKANQKRKRAPNKSLPPPVGATKNQGYMNGGNENG